MLVFGGVHPCFFFRRKCLFRGCKGKISLDVLTEAGLIEELFLECKAALMYRKILFILNFIFNLDLSPRSTEYQYVFISVSHTRMCKKN